jgi:tripartite ATP-independent transporter DctM subunit
MADVILIASLFLGLLLVLYALGIPVAIAMGLTSIIVMVSPIGGGFDYALINTQLFHGLNSFSLLAVPFYLLLGRLMNRIGMTQEIFRFANSVVGQVKGGIAHVNVVASIIFSGMSGLALADVAGLGRVEYRAMQDQGYDKDLSVGVTGSSAIIGPIIPPSVPIIIYAVLAEVSIGDLFLAGVVPGLLIGLMLMASVAVIVNRRGYDDTSVFEFDEFVESLQSALLPMLTPVIIVGGILFGVFTATEAGAVGILYVLVYGFATGRLSAGGLNGELRDSMVETFSLLFILAMASLYGLVALQLRIPILIADLFTSISTDATMIVLLTVVLLLFIGTFMDVIAALTILVPVLLPALEIANVDLTYYGIVMVLALMIGTITPPFGTVLFVLEKVTDVDFTDVVRGIGPFYIPIFLVLLLIIFFPSVVLFLPNL